MQLVCNLGRWTIKTVHLRWCLCCNIY